MLARPTSETGSGSLPTPVKYDGWSGGTYEGNNYHGLGWQARNIGNVCGPASMFPKGFKPSELRSKESASATPLKSDANISKTDYVLQSVEDGKAFNQLAREVRKRQKLEVGPINYPTPTVSAAGKASLPPAVKIAKTGFMTADRPSGSGAQMRIHEVVAAELANTPVTPSKQAKEGLWPTPMCTGLHGGSGVPKDLNQRRGLPTPTALNGLRNSSSSPHHPGAWQAPGHAEYGELNPEWVEWIMGWPIGWTSLKPMPDSNMDDWYALSGAGDDGSNTWWDVDPSEHPETKVPKTVVTKGKKEEGIRQSRIAALGNGQVSAAAAGAWHILFTMKLPKEIENGTD